MGHLSSALSTGYSYNRADGDAAIGRSATSNANAAINVDTALDANAAINIDTAPDANLTADTAAAATHHCTHQHAHLQRYSRRS